jgi:hypothetical protein
MDTAREAELVPIFYREPSREHSTRSLALSALGRCMGMAGSLARAVYTPENRIEKTGRGSKQFFS